MDFLVFLENFSYPAKGESKRVLSTTEYWTRSFHIYASSCCSWELCAFIYFLDKDIILEFLCVWVLVLSAKCVLFSRNLLYFQKFCICFFLSVDKPLKFLPLSLNIFPLFMCGHFNWFSFGIPSCKVTDTKFLLVHQ